MSDHKFEPFDRVIGLNNGGWHADMFSHYRDNDVCVCLGDCYDKRDCITALARSKRLTIIAVRHPEDFSMTPGNCGAMAIRLEIMRGLDNEMKRHRAARDAEEIPIPH